MNPVSETSYAADMLRYLHNEENPSTAAKLVEDLGPEAEAAATLLQEQGFVSGTDTLDLTDKGTDLVISWSMGVSDLGTATSVAEPRQHPWTLGTSYEGRELGNISNRPGAYDAYRVPSLSGRTPPHVKPT